MDALSDAQLEHAADAIATRLAEALPLHPNWRALEERIEALEEHVKADLPDPD